MDEVVGVLMELVLTMIGGYAFIKQALKELEEKHQRSEYYWERY